MAALISTDKRRAILGMGLTGLSVARYLRRQELDFDWYDTRDNPPQLDQIRSEFPDVVQVTGGEPGWDLTGYAEILLSPGISLDRPSLQRAARAGCRILGDIELFARVASAPVLAITGSNGKSTVTAMLGHVLSQCGVNVGVGGNYGTPALDLLDPTREAYVLELSSFQLETVHSLRPLAATILNLSQDHLDRYPDMLAYHAAKQRIYRAAEVVVWNRDDDLTQPMAADNQQLISFGLDTPDLNQYGLVEHQGQAWLARGRELLMAVNQLPLSGRHNWANALAAYALASALGLEDAEIAEALKDFRGLPHRCELVAVRSGVRWINDSKATNVGASIAALQGLAGQGNVVLIAGGQGKGQDFAPLGEAMKERLRALVLIGEDAPIVARVAPEGLRPVFAVSMEAAVKAAADLARSGDLVLLSPACASLDMFSSYLARGDAFRTAVGALS